MLAVVHGERGGFRGLACEGTVGVSDRGTSNSHRPAATWRAPRIGAASDDEWKRRGAGLRGRFWLQGETEHKAVPGRLSFKPRSATGTSSPRRNNPQNRRRP